MGGVACVSRSGTVLRWMALTMPVYMITYTGKVRTDSSHPHRACMPRIPWRRRHPVVP